MATSTMGTKRKPLSISEKLNIISKVDGSPNAPHTKTAEELGIPVATLHTFMYNRNKILKQSLTEQLKRKKIKTAKYEKLEAILVEWFGHLTKQLMDPFLKERQKKLQ
jgi:hypothetical protein